MKKPLVPSVSDRNKKMQTFEVEDVSHDMSFFESTQQVDLEQQALLRRQQQEEEKRMQEPAKNRLNMLLGLLKFTKEFKVKDISFILQIIPSKSHTEIVKSAYSEETNGLIVALKLRERIIAHSLIKIDGIPVESLLSSTAFEDKLNLVRSLDEPLVEYLYQQYQEMNKEYQKTYMVSPEQLVEDAKKA